MDEEWSSGREEGIRPMLLMDNKQQINYYMKKQFLPLMLLASAICSCSEKQPETTEPMITKTEIQVENGLLTPEIMHRLGKVGDVQVSPNHAKILYGVS